ncbi:unnamed protein product [Protopolystoma xenopodis]|uniref:Uncharacterized protein n=1 Tax=Protopolystoma xenopodis TaxID=117903 RepID=A0A3S4ZWW7_9PLAT|nr:unnamed protein product [Protopolystoma xenopodis]
MFIKLEGRGAQCNSPHCTTILLRSSTGPFPNFLPTNFSSEMEMLDTNTFLTQTNSPSCPRGRAQTQLAFSWKPISRLFRRHGDKATTKKHRQAVLTACARGLGLADSRAADNLSESHRLPVVGPCSSLRQKEIANSLLLFSRPNFSPGMSAPDRRASKQRLFIFLKEAQLSVPQHLQVIRR